MSEFEISLSNQQSRQAVDEESLRDAVRAILIDSPFKSATISIAVVDDETIHELNRRFLDHDWPTDVLSFVLSNDAEHLDGEIVVSADTAASVAKELDSTVAAEQALYVIHGTLHLVGYGDKTADEAQAMRAAEERYLQLLGFERPGGFDSADPVTDARASATVRRGAAAP